MTIPSTGDAMGEERVVRLVIEALARGVCQTCRRPCVGDGLGVTPECDRRDECYWRDPEPHEQASAAIEAYRKAMREGE